MRVSKTKKRLRPHRRQKGSALLVSLMVMVGLSLLGLGFVAVSETESAIAMNERNSVQTLTVAETGAKVLVEWFQSPEWTTTNNLMPAAGTAGLKRTRMIAPTVAQSPSDQGVYKPSGTYFCCDRPFRPAISDRLYGTEECPDILIDTTTSQGRAFLATFNTTLFPSNDAGQIMELRVYSAPIIGGSTNTQGTCVTYNHAGDRYGVATVKAIARKYNPPVAFGVAPPSNAQVVAEHAVKIVVAEYPFPGPQGPVQSNANIQTGGDMIVHWGKMTSQGTMFVKRGLVGLPWFDAYTRIPFERGYDSARIWQSGDKYFLGEVVYPSAAARAATPALSLLAYTVTGGSGGAPWTAGGTEPPWAASGTTTGADGMTFTTRPCPQTITDPSSSTFSQKYDWLYRLPGELIQDPWVQVRTRGAITNNVIAGSSPDRTGMPQPFKYYATGQDITDTPDVGFSNWFQMQASNTPQEYQEVVFPKIDYDFWKQTARAGKGTQGVYYMQWVSADNFTDGTTTKTFKEWTNVDQGAQAGFYFFDTMDGQNPQIAGANNLTPDVSVSSGGDNTWQMCGFIYLNATSFGTQGIKGIDGYYNFPGEPFEDIGYFKVTGGTWAASGNTYVLDPGKAGNNIWDYQDVNGNLTFDLVLQQVTRYIPGTTTPVTTWVPAPYVPGCTIGTDCSEPHEPYLNIIYPSAACCQGGSDPIPVQIGWEDPSGTITRRPKAKNADLSIPATNGSGICTNSAEFAKCTSNSYDKYGFMDHWTGTQDAPVLNGVFYNQGTFSSTGNARYFGSVLINGNVDPNGTNEVWFDERLIKEDWPPSDWPFPRVIISAIQTDQ